MSKDTAKNTLSVPVSQPDMVAYTDVVYSDIANPDVNGITAHNLNTGDHGIDERFNPIGQELLEISVAVDGKLGTGVVEWDSKANTTGDTFTGTVQIYNVKPNIELDSNTVAKKAISAKTSGLKRWELVVGDDTPETGLNSGSWLKIDRYSDAGNRLGTALALDRQGTMYVRALEVGDDWYEVEGLNIHWDNVEPVDPPQGMVWMLKENLSPGQRGIRPTFLSTTGGTSNPDILRTYETTVFPENLNLSRIETVGNQYFIAALSDTKDYFRYNGVTYTMTPPTPNRPFFTDKSLANTWMFEDNGFMWFIYTTTAHNMVIYKINLSTMDIQSSHVVIGGQFDQPYYGKRRHIKLPNGKIGLMVLHRQNTTSIYDICRFDIDPSTMSVSRKTANGTGAFCWTQAGTGGWANKHAGFQMVWSKGFFEDIPTPYDTFGEGQTFVSYVTHVASKYTTTVSVINTSLTRITHGEDGMVIDIIQNIEIPWGGLMGLDKQLFLPPTEKRRNWGVFIGEGSNDLYYWQSPDIHTLFRRTYSDNDSIKWIAKDGWIETSVDRYIANDEVIFMSTGYVSNYPSFNFFVHTDTGTVFNDWHGYPQYYPLQDDVANIRYDGKLMYIYASGVKDNSVYVYVQKGVTNNYTAGWENNAGLVPTGLAFANPYPTIYSREPSRITDFIIYPEFDTNNTNTRSRIQLSATNPTSQFYVGYTSTDRGAVSKTYPYIPIVQPQQEYASSSAYYDLIPPVGKDFQVMITAHGINNAQWIDNPSLIYSYYNGRFGWLGKMEDESRRYFPLFMTVPCKNQNGVNTPTSTYLTLSFELHLYNDAGTAKYDLKLISGLNSRDMTAQPSLGPGGTNYSFDLKPKLRFKYYNENWDLLKTVELMSANSDNVVIQSWNTPNYTRTGVMPDWVAGTKWIVPQIWAPWNLTRWSGYPQGHWVTVENVDDNIWPGLKPLYIPTPYGVA